MNRKNTLAFVFLAAICGTITFGVWKRVSAQRATTTVMVPTFAIDPGWPHVPEKWMIAQVGGIAVDSHDHVWVLNRPQMHNGGELAAETNPATDCCVKNPPVMEFDIDGNYIQGWGGPAEGYEWPQIEHGIYVDGQDNVWIGGSGNGTDGQVPPLDRFVDGRGKPIGDGKDDQILKFTRTGKFLLQIGKHGESQGSLDTRNLQKPTKAWVWAPTNEVFVSDGYQNRRVIVFDATTGAFKRLWGAYGNKPDDTAPRTFVAEGPGPQQFNTVHGLAISNDGIVYVCDRRNNRIQTFTLEGKYLTEGFIARKSAGAGTAFDAAFSPDAQQQFMYVIDSSNHKVWILDRRSLAILGSFGRQGRQAGQFSNAHNIAVDSKGNIYTAEATTGARVQKFTFTGMKPVSPPSSAAK